MENNKRTNSNDKELADRKVILFVFIFCIGLFVASIVLPQIFSDLNGKTVSVSVRTAEEAAYTTTYESTEYTEMMSGVVHSASENAEAKEITASVIFPLDINSATAEELTAVKGLGSVTARNIVEYRTLNGCFYSLDELLNVKGIGSHKLEELKDYIYIDPSALPETEFVQTGLEYPETAAVTTVASARTEEYTETAAAPLPEYGEDGIIDDFIMVTEEFITEPDEEDFENHEVFDFEKWYLENLGKRKVTETETETEYCPNFPLELNSASAEDLTYIKGIGTATAEKIVEYARTVGFVSVDDLLNVSGIGFAKLESIRPYVYVIPCGTGTATTVSESEPETTASETETTAETSREIFVNVNTCGKEELMRLPEINEELADDILELRELIGPFKNKDELELAIPAEKLLKIWDHIFV